MAGRLCLAPQPVRFALAFARRGLPVVPLTWPVPAGDGKLWCSCGRKDCTSPAKHPLTPNGLKDGSISAERIETWWRHWPMANVGVLTGQIIVLDVDRHHKGQDGFDTLQDLEREHDELPPTWQFETGGGGWHYVFQAPQGVEIRNSNGKLGPGLDVRGAGGYIVAPGSTHVSGRPYSVSVDHSPDDVPLALLPQWVVERLKEQTAKLGRPASEWREMAREGVDEGARNDAIARMAGHLLRRNVDAILVLEMMLAWNEARFRPPLPDKDVERTVNSIARKELQRRRAV